MKKKKMKVLMAQSSLTLSCHPCLSAIFLSMSSRLHLVSAQTCWICVFASLVCPWANVHRRTSSISCLSYMDRLPDGRYSCYLVRCCFQDLLKNTFSIFVLFPKWIIWIIIIYIRFIWIILTRYNKILASFVWERTFYKHSLGVYLYMS